MTDYMDDLVDRVKVVVGRSTATAFVSPEREDRFFIAEVLFTGAV